MFILSFIDYCIDLDERDAFFVAKNATPKRLKLMKNAEPSKVASTKRRNVWKKILDGVRKAESGIS